MVELLRLSWFLGSYTSLIQQNVDLAKTAVLEAIVMNTGIKPIRVAHMQVKSNTCSN